MKKRKLGERSRAIKRALTVYFETKAKPVIDADRLLRIKRYLTKLCRGDSARASRLVGEPDLSGPDLSGRGAENKKVKKRGKPKKRVEKKAAAPPPDSSGSYRIPDL